MVSQDDLFQQLTTFKFKKISSFINFSDSNFYFILFVPKIVKYLLTFICTSKTKTKTKNTSSNLACINIETGTNIYFSLM